MYQKFTSRGSLSSGLAGTIHTLALMAALVRREHRDPAVREFAERVVQRCPGHDTKCERETLFHFVRDEITFRRDPVDQERIRDVRQVLTHRAGDCDDKAVLLASLLGALGYRSRFIVIGDSPDQFRHVYLESDGVPLDPTPETAQPGWEATGFERWIYDIWPGAEQGGREQGGRMLGQANPPVFPVFVPTITPEVAQEQRERYPLTLIRGALPGVPQETDWQKWALIGAAGILGLVLLKNVMR